MPIVRDALSQRQLDVLRWIADDCPVGVWPDHSHKISVAVLERRRLASVRRNGGKWHAVVLPDGQHYLDHGTYPADPPRGHASVASRATTTRLESMPDDHVTEASANARRRPTTVGRHVSKRSPASQQLVDDILAAGGELTVQTSTDRERSSIEARVRIARARDLVPLGKKLDVTYRRDGTVTLAIVDLPAWMTATLKPIKVPRSLDSPHKVVAKLRDSAHGLPIVGAARRTRALRLLQALITAAENSGYKVRSSFGMREERRQRREQPGQAVFIVQKHEIELRITQLEDRVAHVPTAAELAQKARYDWTRIPKWDFRPTDRLAFTLMGMYVHRQQTWSDSDRVRLEDVLPELLQELGLRAVGAEQARQAAEQRAREARARHEQQLVQARERYTESFRAERLDSQVANWRKATDYRDYVAAIQTNAASLPDPEAVAAALEWAAWASARADELDPFNRKVAMPAAPDPRASDLQPFMPPGTSAYVPQY